MSNQELEVLNGVVTTYYPSEINDSGNWKPAKLVVDTDETFGVEVSFWPKKDKDKRVIEPIQIPILDAIDVETIEGKDVQVFCVFDKIYKKNNGDTVRQYTNAKKLKIIGEDAAPKPEPESKVKADGPKAAVPEPIPAPILTRPIDENQLRIMRQSTLGYATTSMASITKDFATPQLMVEGTIEVARKYLEYVISGQNPSFTTEAEPEQEESDGVIDVDGQV